MSETAAQPELQYDLYYMIPDAAGRRVLLLPGADGWTLPHDRLSDAEAWEYDALCRALRARLGADVTVLRVAQAHIDREVKQQALLIYALENHDPAWAPPTGARWATAAELPALALDPPEARAAVATWLAEEAGAIPAARPPWARRGWLAQATAWIRAELVRRDRALAGPLSQVKT